MLNLPSGGAHSLPPHYFTTSSLKKYRPVAFTPIIMKCSVRVCWLIFWVISNMLTDITGPPRHCSSPPLFSRPCGKESLLYQKLLTHCIGNIVSISADHLKLFQAGWAVGRQPFSETGVSTFWVVFKLHVSWHLLIVLLEGKCLSQSESLLKQISGGLEVSLPEERLLTSHPALKLILVEGVRDVDLVELFHICSWDLWWSTSMIIDFLIRSLFETLFLWSMWSDIFYFTFMAATIFLGTSEFYHQIFVFIQSLTSLCIYSHLK